MRGTDEPKEGGEYLPINAYTVHWSGHIAHVRPDNGTDFQLEELQKIVGGNIEVISIKNKDSARTLVMVLNEDGLALKLKKNYVASKLAKQPVVGIVLVCDSFLIK